MYERISRYEEKSFKRKKKLRESFNREMRKSYVSYRLPKPILDKTRLAKRSSIDSTNLNKMGDGQKKIENRVFLLRDKKSERMKYVSKNRNVKKINYDPTTPDNYDLYCKLYTLMVEESTLKGLWMAYEYSEKKKIEIYVKNLIK